MAAISLFWDNNKAAVTSCGSSTGILGGFDFAPLANPPNFKTEVPWHQKARLL